MTNNKSYQVVNHEYINTGGHCMVLVTTVCDKRLNSTIYVMTDSEGQSMSTVDFISNDLPWLEDESKYISNYYAWPITKTDCPNDDDFELYNDCYQQYLIVGCKDGGDRYMKYEDLPMKLKQQLDADYVEWLKDNEELIRTNGEKVFYEPLKAKSDLYSFDYILDAQEFLSALDNHLEHLDDNGMNNNVSITVGNATLHGYDTAALINGIQEAVEAYLEDLQA